MYLNHKNPNFLEQIQVNYHLIYGVYIIEISSAIDFIVHVL